MPVNDSIPVPPPLPPLISALVTPSSAAFVKLTPREELINCVKRSLIAEDSFVYAFYNHVEPVLQIGPKCGLVAMEMAQQLLCNNGQKLSADQLLESAISQGYTKKGEMFSAANLKQLIESNFESSLVQIAPIESCTEKLLSHLSEGKPILVPYDADRDHRPCCHRNGRSAHWALLTGFLLVSTCNIESDVIEGNLRQCSSFATKMLDGCRGNDDVLVLARHGKSRLLAAWKWSDLVSSNLSLNQVDERFDGEFVLPSGGVAEGLKNKIVFISFK